MSSIREEFNYSDNASFNGYYTINIPQGLDESAVFASTPPYSGLLFYASGNTVYRLDFKQAGGKATAIYTPCRRKGGEDEIR